MQGAYSTVPKRLNMRKTIFILSCALIGCQQNKVEHATNKAPIVGTVSKVTQNKSEDTDSLVAFDKSVYEQKISKQVLSLLKNSLPEWELPHPSLWDKFWFNSYMKNGNLVNYISGDFNCDDIIDYAFILQNKQKEIAIWVLQSEGAKFLTIKLLPIGKVPRIEIGIEKQKKGIISYIDPQNETMPSISLKCEAITVISFEKAAETYYWKNGHYKSIATGD